VRHSAVLIHGALPWQDIYCSALQQRGMNVVATGHQRMVIKAKMPFQFDADHIQWLDRSST
jgi:hypothetical protein